MAAQLTRVPDPLDTFRDDVPPALAAVITRCLEKLPESRPQTANALLDELDGVATPPGGIGPSGAPTAKLPARRRCSTATRALCRCAARGRRGRGGRDQACESTGATVRGPGGDRDSAPLGARARKRPAPEPRRRSAGAARVVLADSATRMPIVLTRAESLAIADAIRKRVTARRDSQVAKGERAIADSLSLRFERALSDSLTRIMAELRGGRRVEVRGFDPKEIERLAGDREAVGAAVPNVAPLVTLPGAQPAPRCAASPGISGAPPPESRRVPPPAPGVRRVLVGAARNAYRRQLAGIGAAVSDSLRRAIAARPGYDAVDAATLTDPRFYAARSRTSLARAVGAGAVLTVLYFPRADSTIVLQLQLFDVQRNRVVRVMRAGRSIARDPMRGVGDLVSVTLTAMNDIDWRSGRGRLVRPKRP